MAYDKKVPSAYDSMYRKAADTHGVSYELLRKLSFNESSFNPQAQSPTGPRGIMQFTKATATGLGLNATDGPDDDRLNPEKAIDAGARHLSDLVRKYNGDELKAALAYNQGEGRLGASQIQAYDQGNFASISSEGVNYMKKLLDVAQSPNRSQVEQFVPKANGVSAQEAFAGIGTPVSKVSTNKADLPSAQGVSIKGTEQEAPNEPFGKSYWEAHGETMDDVEKRSTFFGFQNATEAALSTSAMGVAFRASRTDHGFDSVLDTLKPRAWNSHEFSQEELDQIRREVKDPSYINAVLGGDSETLPDLIKLANENYEADLKAADAGLGAKLSGGVIGMLGDPLTYVPLVGEAAGGYKAFKLVNKAMVVGAQQAGLGVVSEGIHKGMAGGEADYKGAMLGGFVLGSGLSALHDVARAGVRNPFAASSIRMEARETAINSGGDDVSRVGQGVVEHPEGVQQVPHPTQEGAAVLRDGSILSDSNPLNMLTAENVKKALPGSEVLLPRGFAEIGQTILRSDNQTIRNIGSDLIRPATVMGDKSNGKFGATASDIHERLHFTDQQTYRDYYSAMEKAMKDPEWSTGMAKTSAEGVRQTISKRVILEIERPGSQKLSDSDKAVMDIIKGHFDGKREMMENPGIFGDTRARGFFPESRHKGTYVPNVYDRSAKMLHLNRFGDSEGLQDAISKSWLASYKGRPEVAKRVDEALTEELGRKVTMKDVEDYARKKAYGISHEDKFSSSSVLEDVTTQNSLTGIENNSFLEARNLFDSDVEIVAPDGGNFSVNDLRQFDLAKLMPAYDRRVNGDIAIMGGTGKTTAELKEQLMELDKSVEKRGREQGEVNALKDTVKILTGRSRRDPDGAWATIARSLSDLGFASKNAYMGLQNYAEIGGMIAKGNVRMLVGNIPYFGKLVNSKRALSTDEIQGLHSSLFGREMDDLIRPGRQDIIERLRESSDTSDRVANVVGSVKWATGELAARSPLTKFMNMTTNHITDAARQGVLGDIAHAALKGDGKTRWGDHAFLNTASLTDEQYAGIVQLFKDHATVGADGKFSIKNRKAFAQDPRSMDLYRLADKVADESILRPHKVSTQDAKAHGALTKLAMQFKNFTLRSLNGRTMKTIYTSLGTNNRAVDNALSVVLSTGLAGAFYGLQVHLTALGMTDDDARVYREKALAPANVEYAAISRGTTLGAPLGVFNMVAAPLGFDLGNMVRTSVVPKEITPRNEKTFKGSAQYSDDFKDFGGALLQQVPAAGFAANAVLGAKNGFQALTAGNSVDQQDHTTAAFMQLKQVVPNDPVTQSVLLQIFREAGIDEKAQSRPH